MKQPKEHLTEKEQHDWLLGERAPAAAAHLGACAECRSAVEGMEAAFVRFRAASLDWSAEAGARVARALPHKAAPRSFPHTWAAGCAAAALAVAVGFVGLHPRSSAPAASTIIGAGLSDDALLERVDQQVADSVPEAMQPLAGTNASSETTR